MLPIYSPPNASGGVLFLPAGTYVLSNQAVAPNPSFQVGPDCMKLTGWTLSHRRCCTAT